METSKTTFLIVTAITTIGKSMPHYREPDIPNAIAWISDAIEEIEQELEHKVNLLVLPSGYLEINDFNLPALNHIAAIIYRLGITTPIATIIDATGYGESNKQLKPFYGVIMKNGKLLGLPVQQTSSKKKEGENITAHDAQIDARIKETDGISVGLVCCGEIFAGAVTQVFGNRKPEIVVNMVHNSFDDWNIKEPYPDNYWISLLKTISGKTNKLVCLSVPTKLFKDKCFYFKKKVMHPSYTKDVSEHGIILQALQLPFEID